MFGSCFRTLAVFLVSDFYFFYFLLIEFSSIVLSFMLSRSMYLSGCVVHETGRLVQPVCSTRQFFIQCHGSGNVGIILLLFLLH